MISRTELTDFLDQLLLDRPYNDYGPNGLQLEGSGTIERVATAVSASLATIEAAVDYGAQALIVHHGLFWKADEMRLTGWMARRVALLLEHQISLLAYHLPLDAHRQLGNNWGAALDLGWRDLKPFFQLNGVGLGVQGQLNQPIGALKEQLEAYYGHTALHCPGGPAQVQQIALLSGNGYRAFGEAAAAGADCLVTGVVDEPAWHWAQEGKVHILALGHCATEKVGPKKLASYLNERLQIDCKFLNLENPL
jgi:dinuclear metal center YbgI/SA1388 family protein